MKVCLVTGAAGFIGQHLVSKLSGDGYNVIAIDKNRDYLPLIFKENNIKIKETTESNVSKGTVIFRYGDIADKDFIRGLFEDIEKCGSEIHFIFHLAACATIQEAIKEREKTYRTNYDGTLMF